MPRFRFFLLMMTWPSSPGSLAAAVVSSSSLASAEGSTLSVGVCVTVSVSVAGRVPLELVELAFKVILGGPGFESSPCEGRDRSWMRGPVG